MCVDPSLEGVEAYVRRELSKRGRRRLEGLDVAHLLESAHEQAVGPDVGADIQEGVGLHVPGELLQHERLKRLIALEKLIAAHRLLGPSVFVKHEAASVA